MTDEPATTPQGDENDDADLLRLTYEEKEILLLGTAHVSQKSADAVKRIIERERPDTVCVELCESRMAAIENQEAWRAMDIVKVIREKRVYLLMSHLLLAAFQRKIAENLNIQAGAEMLAAMDQARAVEAEIVPADRDIRTTLARTWRLMSFRDKAKLLMQLVGALSDADEITEEDVEALKEKDALELMLQELGDELPGLRRVLIDERDLYLTESIRKAPGKKIVAVVGAGHVPGIIRNWEEPVDLEALTAMPPKSKLIPFFKWGIPLLVFLVIGAGFAWSGTEAGLQMVGWWFGVNAALAGLGAVIALAHPLTILAAMAAAPLTSVNPTIAAGWVSGLTEAWLRKPQVKDLEAIPTDIVTVRGFWKNRAIRILLVVVFTNIGSMIGTFVALPLMARYLGQA